MAAPVHSPSFPDTPASARLRLGIVAWLFIGGVVCLLAFAYYSMHLLAATRAYVGGEGRWSTAQKEVVYSLGRYARSRDDADWEAYQAQLRRLLGSRKAREELTKAAPDMAIVRQGFAEGGNHPGDVAGMAHLYRRFRWVPEIDFAIKVWADADGVIDGIQNTAARLRQAHQQGTLDDALLESSLQELHQANQRLTPLEEAFSTALAESARLTRSVVLGGLVLLATALLGGALLVARRMLVQNARMQRVLARGEQQLRSLIQVAPMPLAIIRTGDNSFVYANDRALAQFKLSAKALGKHAPRDIYYQQADRDRFWSTMLLEGRLHDFELQMQASDGEPFWALVSAERVAYGGADCVLVTINNIEQRRRAQDALRHRAFHDELTGLPNRAQFMEGLQRTMSRVDRKGASCSVLFIDLDHFKDINDTWGHAAGDMLLTQVARRIRHAVREGDLVARLGGDEFVILIEDAGAEELSQIARNLLDALQQPYTVLDDVPVQVTCSIGISIYPQDGKDLDALVQNADHAMYRAKAQGRNNYQFSEFGNLGDG